MPSKNYSVIRISNQLLQRIEILSVASVAHYEQTGRGLPPSVNLERLERTGKLPPSDLIEKAVFEYEQHLDRGRKKACFQ